MNRLLLILFIGITGIFNNSLQAQTPSLIICKGSNVNYKEFNDPGSLPSVAWAWKFDGATPGTSTDREPQNINYPDTGLFKTECTSTFNNGTKSTKSVYVLVIWANPELFNPRIIENRKRESLLNFNMEHFFISNKSD